MERQLAALDFTPDRLLLSFHGMPQRTLELGDPYHCHCRKTARLLGEAMGRPVDVAFQSSGLTAIARSNPSGWVGGADPRREGLAMGDTG